MRLDDKVAIISGGATGIGAATARLFTEVGAHVVVTGRRPEPLQALATEIGALAMPGDVTDPEHCPGVVAETLDRFGTVDAVVGNAGVGLGGSVGEVDDDRWQTTIDINLTGAMRLVRAVLPAMLERSSGSIVLVASVSGHAAATDSAAYVASKHGLIGLVRSLAVDYGPRGIRANALSPGWVVTPMADSSMDELGERDGIDRMEAYSMATTQVPLRRPARPEEIAWCALFLASDQSSYVNGADLVVDGGALATEVGSIAFDQGD